MSTAANERIPELTLGWRLRMALGNLNSQEMADYLGVDRSTVSRWMNDHGAAPKRAFIVQWAVRTGVSPEWIETGVAPAPQPPSPGNKKTATGKHPSAAELANRKRRHADEIGLTDRLLGSAA